MEKLAVIGQDGRAHAFKRQARRSLENGEVISMPGNPGMAEIGECFAVDLNDPVAIAEMAAREKVDFALVSPEIPFINGVVDELERRDIQALGPDSIGARLEGSKKYMKETAVAAGVPTAAYDAFHKGQESEAIDYYASLAESGVVKADGPAAGKGVALPKSCTEAEQVIRQYLSGEAFGKPGETIIIEERLYGREISLLALCDGERAIQFGTARDYKRLLDGDEGPNTGGMGSFSPVEDVPPELVDELMRIGVIPTVEYLAERGTPYSGILYAGFMLTEQGPMLLEYNVRSGDPETQVIVPRLKSNLLTHLRESADGKLSTQVEFTDEVAVTIALASPGYPENSQTGGIIEGLAEATNIDGVDVFHAGTARRGNDLVTAGGRVLYPTGFSPDKATAPKLAYEAVNKISWPGIQYRSDIAK